ncbi:MAG: T9SS type A sorting domain-containing protein, partial [Flavobacteriales bacterium]|nr:T9SS type A sorting domain-containing protein [Flavobacteriales bacterium]
EEVETELLQNLLENEGFHDYFNTRAADLLNSYLRSDKVIEEVEAYKSQLESGITLQFNAWGSSQETWDADIDYIGIFASMRPDSMRQNFTEFFDLGQIYELDLNTISQDAGFIEVNTIETDEIPWHGHYFEDLTVRLKAVPHSGYTFSHWQETGGTNSEIWVDLSSDTLLTAVFLSSGDPQQLVINEIMYDPEGEDSVAEWIELYNPNEEATNLAGWSLCDEAGNCATLNGIEIQPGEYFVLCRNQVTFENTYPGVQNFSAAFDFNLGNSGDVLTLVDPFGTMADEVGFFPISPWPLVDEGQSIQLSEVNLDNNQGSSWFANDVLLETPGAINQVLTGVIAFEESQFLVYPNPSSDYLRISTNKPRLGLEAKVFTSDGSLVDHFSIIAQDTESVLDIRDYPAGIYVVQIANGDRPHSFTFEKISQ